MEPRSTLIEMMGKITKNDGTPETVAMGLILIVLLDIRDQNTELLRIRKQNINETTQLNE